MAGNTNIGKWSGQATLDAGGFAKGARQVERSAQTMGSRLEKIFGQVGATVRFPGFAVGFSSLTTALGVQAGRGLGEGINQELQKNLNLGFLNDQLGTSIEWLSKLQTVTAENSVSQEQFITGMQKLHATLGEASMGGAAQMEIFERLGVSMEKIRGQSFDATFEEIAGALSRVESRAERARLATELFGRGEGARMLRSLRGGREGLAAAMGDVETRGGFQTTEGQARLEELDNAMDRVTTAWDNAWRNFLTATAPALTATFNEINRIVAGVGEAWARLTGGGPVQNGLLANDNRTFDEATAAQVEYQADVQRARDRVAERQREVEAAQQEMPAPSLWDNDGARARGMMRLESAQANLDSANRFLERSTNRVAQAQERLRDLGYETAIAVEAAADEERDANEDRARRFGAIDRQRDERDYADIDRLNQQMQTPFEAFQARLERLNELSQQGLGDETYQRALAAAVGQLGGNTPERQLPGSYDVGSAQGLSLINQNRANPVQSAMERVRETLTSALELQRTQRDYQREMRDALKALTDPGGEFEDVLDG